jgi:hypothetical protein
VPAQTQQTPVQRLSPKNKAISPYIPLQAGYRSKKKSSTHIWLHVTSLAISLPQCYVTFFMFQFFKFYLSALPSPPPASLSEHSLSVSLLVLIPAYNEFLFLKCFAYVLFVVFSLSVLSCLYPLHQSSLFYGINSSLNIWYNLQMKPLGHVGFLQQAYL